MKRVVGIVAGLAVLAMGAVGMGSAVAAPSEASSGRADVVWEKCANKKQGSVTGNVLGGTGLVDEEPAGPGVECATVRVPLDYREPMGQTIKIALNRVKGSVSRDHNHLGTLLVNPGGPGASGRELAEYVAAALPGKLAERFDVIGFDPRGVGASEPALRCVDPAKFYAPPRPDAVPRTGRDQTVLQARARDYAERCGNLWAWMLPHMTTENVARDMDTIRAALDEQEISYLGYSYGTYLGAAYATLYPERVKRLVLDSSVDPDGVWYKANLAQDRGFERRHRDFLAWTAKNNKVYKLGRTAKQASFAWYQMRSRLRERPAGGVVGPSELDDIFTVGGYTDTIWPSLAQAWASYVRKGETKDLVAAFRRHGEKDAEDENGYAVYLGVQCRDAAWPRDWKVWQSDMSQLHRKAPFLTWPNAWYNAPCAYWPVPGGKPPRIQGAKELPPVLMLQSKGDAATPYVGALNMRKLFPTARMLTESGGNHGISLAGNRCVDKALAAYLADTTVPKFGATCPSLPAPRPAARMSSGLPQGHERLTEVIAR
ncbi:alpha/beta hydrolase [Nonomuraea endophytica]|uniref:Pimeloyl-ACP methyl ester carboxylesterase n=1 Tax=Nonomuraea endophytica TaxID=714136 RepID=A0A7W8A9B7_9ACTN|nr:alpha/beta hydrolase [Nonomuraea endophytica]MBB5080628.1 pimeloyl-ACP methyl ester carboxylesterase [Nonomuraea endophytica]